MTDPKRSQNQPDDGQQGADGDIDQGRGTPSTRDTATADDRGMDWERRDVSTREGDLLEGEIMDDTDADDDLGGMGRSNR